MATAALEQERLAEFRPKMHQVRQQRKPGVKPRGQVIKFKQSVNRPSRPAKTPGTVIDFPNDRKVDTEQMYNQGKSPEARAQLEEQHKQAEMQRRNQAKIKRDAYKMPSGLSDYIGELAKPGKDYVQTMYEKELDNQGMDKLLDQQFGRTPLRTTKMVLNREKAKMQKAAMDAVKKQAKKALQEVFKQGLKGGKQIFTKTFWSSFAQGSIVEAEGAMLETWFGSGTATGSYQSLIGLLHGGKKLLGEKGVLSFIEPDPFKLPSQTQTLNLKSIATSGGTNLLIAAYDLFGLIILTPLYIFLIVAIFILANLLLMLIIFPYVFAANNITYFLDFFGLL